jgi:curved DNA-binding protein CbpA
VPAPTRIDGLGPPDVVPRLSESWDPTGSNLTPEDYFVLTRVDGKSSLKQIWTVTGFSEDKAAGILHKLRTVGAILFPGDVPKPRKPPDPVPEPIVDGGSGRFSFDFDTYDGPPIDAKALMAEGVELSEDQKQAIIQKFQILQSGNLFELLGVASTADRREIKRAYFKISKEFHPDRFYGKSLGSFREKLALIFERATQAFDFLSDDGKRAKYLGEMGGPPGGEQSRKDHAAELFKNAVQLEIDRDPGGAMKLFAAAIRLDPLPRYLKRAAEASLRAQELRSAEEYAKKAAELDPRDAGAHRTLAKVLRAIGRPAEARKELELAFRLEPGNPYIAAELEEISKLGGS